MGTPYSDIYDGFIKQLRNDKEFFNYKGLTDNEIQTLVKDHLLNLLCQSVDYIYTWGIPSVNFYDMDGILEQFNFDLTNYEIGMIVSIMYFNYMSEGLNKLKILGLTFSSKEISIFSPANDRNSYMNLLNTLEDGVRTQVINYLNRDRLTWKMKCSSFG